MPKVTKKVKGNLVAVTNVAFTTGRSTGWLLAYGGATLRAWMDALEATPNYRWRFRYRTAAVTTSKPDAWQDFPATVPYSGSGQQVEDKSLSAIGNKLWIQLQVAHATAGSGQVGEASVELQGQIDGRGLFAAIRQVQIEPETNTSQTSYTPISGRFPTLGLAGIMGGFIVSGVAGTLNYGLAIRYLVGDDKTPGPWIDAALFTGVTGSERRNSGDIPLVSALAPGNTMWAQLAISSTGASGLGTVQVVVAARYS